MKLNSLSKYGTAENKRCRIRLIEIHKLINLDNNALLSNYISDAENIIYASARCTVFVLTMMKNQNSDGFFASKIAW